MQDLTAKRTLVKSPPELWEELSEVDRLAKHLSAFGEITITKLEPEHTVAWEGEHVSGTVSIEPSGWGTKVTLRAELPEETTPREPEPPAPEPEPEPEPPPQAEAEPGVAEAEPEPVAEPAQPRGFWLWLFRPRRLEPITEQAIAEPPVEEPGPPVTEPEPPVEEPEPPVEEPEPAAEAPEAASRLDPDRARVILDEALDTLGAAHHRPFSRG